LFGENILQLFPNSRVVTTALQTKLAVSLPSSNGRWVFGLCLANLRFDTRRQISAGGCPLDKTYDQTIKGMVGAMDILKPSGTIIIAGEISEGMGSEEFVAAQKMLGGYGEQEFMEILSGRSAALIGEWQTEMLLKPQNLSENKIPQTTVEHTGSLQEAVPESVSRHSSREIGVIPEGSICSPPV
jgi:nickel-dependent lactate racemase